MKTPLRIYFDSQNGQVIQMTGNFDDGSLQVNGTVDEEIPKYHALSERNRETFDVLELPFGAYQNEFETATSYRVNPTTKELEFNYDPLFTLEDYKQFKLEELTKKCTEVILGRFNSTVATVVYQFSNDIEAQSNFKDAIWALENNKATSVAWTTYDTTGQIARISLDLIQLSNVNVDRLTHQQTNVGKLRDVLQPRVEACATKAEVEAIVW